MLRWLRQQFRQSSPSTGHGKKSPRWRARRCPLAVEPLEERALLATFTVTHTLDDGSPGSLRWAIDQANATTIFDTINFNIPCSGVKTIGVTAPLPAINGAVTLDGSSATALGPFVELDGSNAGTNADGLVVRGMRVTIRGLIINGFSGDGIELGGDGFHHIQSCYIGTNADGTVARANGGEGIHILPDSVSNTIGSSQAGLSNLISGNTLRGISIRANNTRVQGNRIGTGVDGLTAIPNRQGGIRIEGSTTLVGGTTAVTRNLISGNDAGGVILVNGSGNQVQGNYIGVNRDGDRALANATFGVALGGTNNLVGGTMAGMGNVISGNSGPGITISGINNDVQANRIGTNAAGDAALPNTVGVVIGGGSNNIRVGSTTPAARNLISGNTGHGVDIQVSSLATVQGNYIGTNAAGTAAVPNGQTGVNVDGTQILIGGLGLGGLGNLISGNLGPGVSLNQNTATLNRVLLNRIGTDANGGPLGNGSHGVVFTTTGGTLVAQVGSIFNEGNIIAFNRGAGVFITGGNAISIRANSIHSNDGLGIDLAPTGVNPNDSADGDAGPNLGQNYPILTAAASTPAGTVVVGSLNSRPNTNYFLDFYSSPTPDPSGHGEGAVYLGTAQVRTDAGGNVIFAAPLSTAVALGQFVTATAVGPNNDTSEFSQPVPATVNGPPTISDIANQATDIDTPTEPIPFTVGDGQTPAELLTVSGSSSNPALVPNASIVFGGSGANRTVTITPAPGQSGTATITVTVSDGVLTTSDTFVLVVANTLRVRLLERTNTGFVAHFNRAIDPRDLNLYEAQNVTLGPPDAALTGLQGPVRGSLIVDPSGLRVTFVRTGGLLPNSGYSVFLRSAANGFRALDTGELLDGNSDGTPGGDFTGSFVVAGPTLVSANIPDFARGPGQQVDLRGAGSGLPLRLTEGTGVTRVDLTLGYDPALLNVLSIAAGPTVPAGAELLTQIGTNEVTLTLNSPTAFGPGPIDFVILTASVPETAPYASKQVLDIRDLQLNGGDRPALDDDGIQVVAYPGDATGNGSYTSADATRILGVAVGQASGLAAYQLADPAVVVDANGNGRVNATDALFILRESLGIDQPEVPPLPDNPVVLVPGGPDPLLNLPRRRGLRGSTFTVPLNLDRSDGLDSADLALSYDVQHLEVVAVRRGSLTADFDLFAVRLDPEAGTIRVGLGRSAGPLSGRGKGSVLSITFRIKPDAPAGRTVINLRRNLEGTVTQLNEGGLDLNPDPSDQAGDALDGVVQIAGKRRQLLARDLVFAAQGNNSDLRRRRR